ncbi:MAG: Fe-S cluster assembly protein SufD [Ignavibacteria bacterium]|nr:Fe-S cluster assembly protein SufD [Ignavibacteria bacterium]
MENIIEKYLTQFRESTESLNGNSVSGIHKLRTNAIEKFHELGFPTTKNEDWKYTNVSVLNNFHFRKSPVQNLDKSLAEKYKIPGLDAELIVIVNGIFSHELSEISSQPDGVVIGSLKSAENDLLNAHLGKYSEINNGFTALNTALAGDGVLIYVPDNTVLKKTVHIIYLSGDDNLNALVQPRNLIIAGENSRLNIIETYHSIYGNETLLNSVTEIKCGRNSGVKLYRLQSENNQTFHINLTEAHLEEACNYSHYSVTLGGRLVRNDTNIVLDAENSTGNLYGLYLTEENQHVDNHTLIDHRKPHCQSNELYKGILSGKSHGVFNGKVFVRKDAQKTNAYQSNKAILLSDDAKIDTKPQLEIFADDVKCSHGAAIGQLDEQALFYLRSRGIDEANARKILLRAFANDVFEKIEDEVIHNWLNEIVTERLK